MMWSEMRVSRHLLAVFARGPAIGHVFDDLHDVAVGILHVEVLVARLAFAHAPLSPMTSTPFDFRYAYIWSALSV